MRRVIHWFASNGVAANLLMVLIMVGGLGTLTAIRLEVFPEFSSDLISVSVVYPGAAPAEVEEGVVVRIEEAIQGLDGVKKITSTSRENVGSVRVELLPEAELRQVLSDVKARVDAIDTFPEEAEEPLVEELVVRRQVIYVTISGAADERTLKILGEQVRDDLASLPEITQVELASARPYEISIEISEEALRQWGLTFDQVAQAIRRSALDLPGGSVDTAGGEILLRTEGQVYRGDDFARLPLVTLPDGRRIAIGEVATVVDGFAETDQAARFDGQPAVLVQVFRVGEQGALEIAAAVQEYVAGAQLRMPEGIQLTTWQDDTSILRSRISLLLRNGRAGLFLVLLVLALFLKVRLAGWVALGIPISFLGAIALMPANDVSINLISLFAFIVVLGIVVDDAIVVGENIYTRFQRGERGLEASVNGAHEVTTPVVFAVLTTVAAFAPLLFVPGNIGKIMRVIPLIVIPTLVFSLIESLLVLPNHLSHATGERRGERSTRLGAQWHKWQEIFSIGLERFIHGTYRRLIERALEWRYLTLAIALAALIITAAAARSGWVRFVFFPDVEADNVVALLTMPEGTPARITGEALERIERSARELEQELEERYGQEIVRHTLASIGEQPFRTNQTQGAGSPGTIFAASNLGEVNLELVPSEEREVSSGEIGAMWRERTGRIYDATELTYTTSIFNPGSPISVQVSGPDIDELAEVAAEVQEALRSYPGVFDITDSYRAGKQELELELTPEAEAAGLTLADLARQVRQAFYGEEAQRIQRGRDDVKVMVRFPESDRQSLTSLETMRVRTPQGLEIPFSTAARATISRGPSAIQRTDRQRVIQITADVDVEKTTAGLVLADLERDVLPDIQRRHPRIRYSFEGEQDEQRQTLGGLARGFAVALFVIYGLLAVPFRSYLQPFIVMSAIPFGLIGAVLGHVIMGKNLTILSMFGIVALTGVVVNDSLVLVDFVNRRYRGGLDLKSAIRDAGMARFRPILLTSLTTFAGLLPLLLERSLQAQFLIPMAISLAFGVLFATGVILLLVPTLYFILEDLRGLVLGKRPEEPAEASGAIA